MQKTRWFSFGAALALAVSMTACGDDDEKSQKEITCEAWGDVTTQCGALFSNGAPTCEATISDCNDEELEVLEKASKCAAAGCADGSITDMASAAECLAPVVSGAVRVPTCFDPTSIAGG